MRSIAFLLVFALAGCGDSDDTSPGAGGTSPVDGGTGGGNTGGSAGSGGQAGQGGSGANMCGNLTCGADEVCIHPCCGGAPPFCEPIPEGGVCPPGTHHVDFCEFGSSGPGCEMDPCTPPDPYCHQVAPNCGSPPDCTCLPQGCCTADQPGHFACLCA